MVRRLGYVQSELRKAHRVGVGVSELHFNHPPGAARRYQEWAFVRTCDGYSGVLEGFWSFRRINKLQYYQHPKSQELPGRAGGAGLLERFTNKTLPSTV
jgi:hypothetical protein